MTDKKEDALAIVQHTIARSRHGHDQLGVL